MLMTGPAEGDQDVDVEQRHGHQSSSSIARRTFCDVIVLAPGGTRRIGRSVSGWMSMSSSITCNVTLPGRRSGGSSGTKTFPSKCALRTVIYGL